MYGEMLKTAVKHDNFPNIFLYLQIDILIIPHNTQVCQLFSAVVMKFECGKEVLHNLA